jgi:hypothetical protein
MRADEKGVESMNVVPEVHKFNFDGDFIVRYILDRPVTRIAVSEDDTECYAIGIDPNYEASVVKFLFN